MDVDLVAVGEAVVVGVGVVRVGPERQLLAVGEPVVVGVGVDRQDDGAECRGGRDGRHLRVGEWDGHHAGGDLCAHAGIEPDLGDDRIAHQRVEPEVLEQASEPSRQHLDVVRVGEDGDVDVHPHVGGRLQPVQCRTEEQFGAGRIGTEHQVDGLGGPGRVPLEDREATGDGGPGRLRDRDRVVQPETGRTGVGEGDRALHLGIGQREPQELQVDLRPGHRDHDRCVPVEWGGEVPDRVHQVHVGEVAVHHVEHAEDVGVGDHIGHHVERELGAEIVGGRVGDLHRDGAPGHEVVPIVCERDVGSHRDRQGRRPVEVDRIAPQHVAVRHGVGERNLQGDAERDVLGDGDDVARRRGGAGNRGQDQRDERCEQTGSRHENPPISLYASTAGSVDPAAPSARSPYGPSAISQVHDFRGAPTGSSWSAEPVTGLGRERAGAGDEGDGDDDERERDPGGAGDRLAPQPDAERDRHHRVHVGVAGHLRGRHPSE